jgi:hypothetical protein
MVEDSVITPKHKWCPHHSHTTPCCDRTICPRNPTHLLCRESPITGGNICNIVHKIPVHWIYALKHRMPLPKGRCTDVWLYILRLVEIVHQGCVSNCIPKDYVKKQNRPFIVLWHVQDTEVVCHKKSPFHCLVQFVFIWLHECNEVT